MNIVIVHYAEPVPKDFGFTKTRYCSISSELVRRGHAVTRIFPSFDHRARAKREFGSFVDEEFGSFVVVPTCSYKKSRSLARFLFLRHYKQGVLNVLKDLDPSIVLVGMPPPGLSKAIKESAPCSLKIIVDLRDLWPDAQIATSKGLQRILFRMVKPLFRAKVRSDLQSCMKVIALSPSYMNWALALEPNVTKLPRRVFPLGAAKQANSKKQQRERRGIVFVGTLSELFDFDLLFEAWSRVEQSRPELARKNPLIIVGSGSQSEYVNRKAQCCINASILGHLPHADALRLMSTSIIGVAPYSKGEHHTMPNKFFEYMASGLVVVTTLGGDAKNLIDKYGAGYAAPDCDADQFAKLLIGLLDAPAVLNEMASGSQRCASDYDRDEIAKQVCDFIES